MPRLFFQRSITRALPLLFAVALLGVIATPPATAAQFNVTTVADSGAGSLRQALLDAAATSGDDDVIVQPALGLINALSELAWGGVSGANAVTIDGNGVRVDFNGAGRGFVDNGGDGVTIRNMEITGVGGGAALADDAAPVVSQGGAMVLTNCTIFDNRVATSDGDVGGAVLSEGGPVTVTDCTFRNNTAEGPFDASTVLSEGGTLTVTGSLIENNRAQGGGNSGGGLESEGGAVTVTNTIIRCNRATAGNNADAAGGLLSEGGAVTVTDSTFTGNVGNAPGTGTDGSAIVSNGPTPTVTNTTIDESTSSCGDVITSYFLPKRIKVVIDSKDAAKSQLIAAGFIDLGPDVVDLSGAASLDIGGFHFEAPSLTPKGNGFIFKSGGTRLLITPKGFGSSRAKFKLKSVGDFTGKIDPQGLLDLRFSNGAFDAVGKVELTDGRFALGKIRGALIAPNLYLARVRTTLKGPGNDALAMVAGLATGGVTPATAADLTIAFGDNFLATIPGASFTKVGDKFVFEGNTGGITKVTLNYARETITVVGKGLDLGQFAEGGNRVLISIGLGADTRAVVVRMVRKRVTMKY